MNRGYSAAIFRNNEPIHTNSGTLEATMLAWARILANNKNGDILIISEYRGEDQNEIAYYEFYSKYIYKNGKWRKPWFQ